MNEKARAGEARIGKQIVLPWSKAVEIAAKSVKVRFWRSMITMSSIVLAIAFLMSIWTSTAITASLAVAPQLAIQAVDAEIAARGSEPGPQPALDGLQSRRARLVEMKTEVDAILQEERGELYGDAVGAPKPSKAALGTSVTDFVSRMTPTDTWLAILALLVCLVGIANAMFMTVQERFREIGTMKCLGAMDGFIVKIFLIESAALGLIGTLLGVLIGMLLSALRQWFVYGSPAWTYFPWKTVFVAGLLAGFIGLVLSIAAAIWPATKAARMEPVEAMRVDE